MKWIRLFLSSINKVGIEPPSISLERSSGLLFTLKRHYISDSSAKPSFLPSPSHGKPLLQTCHVDSESPVARWLPNLQCRILVGHHRSFLSRMYRPHAQTRTRLRSPTSFDFLKFNHITMQAIRAPVLHNPTTANRRTTAPTHLPTTPHHAGSTENHAISRRFTT